MVACPQCQSANPDFTEVCGRCGTNLLALSAVTLPAPLPAPMVEPIQAPPRPPDSELTRGKPALKPPFGEQSPVLPYPGPRPVRAEDVTPAPVTVRDLTARRPPTDELIAPGTVPAMAGLSGHPMNDSAVQNPPQTIPATAPADQPPAPVPASPAVRPKLVVLRGMKINAEYPIYEGRNTIGRFADKPVDIDLMAQEPIEQIWCSRQHAVITYDRGTVVLEDLNSLNGTWVNGSRIHPGQARELKPGDVVQIGTVQMKLIFA
jgi:hypothetical protein